MSSPFFSGTNSTSILSRFQSVDNRSVLFGSADDSADDDNDDDFDLIIEDIISVITTRRLCLSVRHPKLILTILNLTVANLSLLCCAN